MGLSLDFLGNSALDLKDKHFHGHILIAYSMTIKDQKKTI